MHLPHMTLPMWTRMPLLGRLRMSTILVLATICLTLAGFSGANSAPPAPVSLPQFDHVIVVVEENASYGDVVGGRSMPYLNSLISKYGLATNYYANTHPSIGNYFMMTTGTIVTNDDSFVGTVPVDNLVRQFAKDGK